MTRARACALLAATATLAACAHGGPPTPLPASFDAFVDRYFDALADSSPTWAVSVGFHRWDARIEDLSAAAYEQRIATLDREQAELDTLRARPLDQLQSIDATMIDNAIKSELLSLRTLQTWRNNPMNYVGAPGSAIDVLMKRDFAPARQRLESVITRLAGVPPMLDAMRANITEPPPPEFTDLAIRMSRGSVGFFRESAALWARDAAGGDADALARFTVANERAAAAMDRAAQWLESDLRPRSTGDYAIGADAFAAKLRDDEMVTIPLPALLSIGQATLAKDGAAFERQARIIDPSRTAHEVWSMVEEAHPTAASLLDDTRARLEGTRQFLIDHRIVDLPSEARAVVAETPPYARNGGSASMDTAGPFETSNESYFYVTPPEADWDAQHVEEHLRQFNPDVMELLVAHEAYPGHYVQFLYAPGLPTKTRKLLGASSNIEGWAHYGEQMMLEEGFGNGDPRVALAQLEEALLRDCRFVVGIGLHTQGMTVEQGARMFEQQCYQEPATALEEARRGTYDPTYLYYTLGKLQIFKLREDVKRAQGSAFSLRDFHDRFLQQGSLPMELMRPLMLPGDGSPTL